MNTVSSLLLLLSPFLHRVSPFHLVHQPLHSRGSLCTPPPLRPFNVLGALSKYLEDDIVSVESEAQEFPAEMTVTTKNQNKMKLYVVRSDGTVSPLCSHEDDNPTDLYVDPRSEDVLDVSDDDVVKCYGEGWYSQRVVPSLGGGPGYGAVADDVWSIEEEILDKVREDGVELPVLDLGIAHGEKARGGAI